MEISIGTFIGLGLSIVSLAVALVATYISEIGVHNAMKEAGRRDFKEMRRSYWTPARVVTGVSIGLGTIAFLYSLAVVVFRW